MGSLKGKTPLKITGFNFYAIGWASYKNAKLSISSNEKTAFTYFR